MTFALRSDDGDIHPDQMCYVNGYGIEERYLEDVRFKVEIITNSEGLPELICNGVHPEDEGYMQKFSDKQRAIWNEAAIECLTEYDADGTAEDGTNLHWGEA